MTNKKGAGQHKALIQGPRRRSRWLLVPFIALFAFFGVVIILRSFAATAPNDPNDVLRGGFATTSEATARSQTIAKLNSSAAVNKGAKQLFAYFGITDKEISTAKLVPGINPRTSSYANWLSFGRTQRPGSTGLTVGGVTFWSKPVKNAWAAGTVTTQPMLKGKTKDGRDFLIHAECGNLVLPNLKPYKGTPHATIKKEAVSPAAGSNVKPGDTIKYRITAKSDGNTDAYVVIADAIPVGTTFESGEIETKNAIPIATETRNNQKVYRWANYGLIPGASIKILVSVKVNADTKTGFCNIAYLSWFKGQTLPAASAKICHNITPAVTPPPPPPGPNPPPPPPPAGSPNLQVEKTSVDVPAGSQVKPGETVITYKVVGRNVGTADASNVSVLDGVQDNGWFQFVELGPLLTTAGQPVPTSNIAETIKDKPITGYKYYGYTLKALKANESVNFTIKFKVIQASAPTLKVCDLATISDAGGVKDNAEVCHSLEGIEKHKSAIFLGRNGTDGKPLPADGKNIAKAGDAIQYTLTTKNLGSKALSAYQIDEDLNDVLEYADVTDNGGGTLTNGILSWKADIAVGATDTRMFKIKVKSPIPNQTAKASSPGSYDYKMVNIYGDTVEIPVEKPVVQTIIDTLPQTGALGLLMIPLVLATLILLAYTSGIFSRTKTHQQHRELQPSAPQQASVTPAHKAGDQFHPEPRKPIHHDEEQG